MPKTLTPRRLVSLLKSHGFLLKRTKGSHFIFQHPENKRRVIVPMHQKDLPKGTPHEIFKQAGISSKDL